MSALDRSPRLNALLARLRARVVRLVWLHGLGTVAAATALWLLFAFLADWLLHVPAPVRVLHTAVLVALPLWFLRRDLWRLLRRVPDRAGLAMLVEREHPELSELLVSAVQLDPEREGASSRALIERVVAEAEVRAERVEIERIVDPRRPRRRFVLGALAVTVTLASLAVRPALAGIFFARMLGSDVSWPQRTHLSVEVPIVGDRAQIAASDGRIDVRLARGSDVPVIVRAAGMVPDEVTLRFTSGHTAVLTSGGTPLFRTLLRSVQEDLEFRAVGGDDQDGLPLVTVTVLQPPDVAGLAVRVVPPAYSGLPERLEFDTDVEVLEGSRVIVHALPDPPDARGVARLLPEDRVLELQAVDFPAHPSDEAAGEGTDRSGEAARQGLAFELVAEDSLRFRFELTDATGLPNPDPGLFGIQVVPDRRPDVLLISPARAEVDVVPGGALALRVRAEDDFGLERLAYEVRDAAQEDAAPLSGAELVGEAPTGESADGRARAVRVARVRLEVDRLAGGAPPEEGRQLSLRALATDDKQPNPNSTQSAPVRLRVVSGDEFLRRVQDSLARAGEQANRLSQLQEEKLRRTRELIAALSSDGLEAGDSAEVGVLLTGQRRVHGDARALARDLAAIAESLLYARIDDRGGPLLEALDAGLARYSDRSFHPEPWRELADAYSAGSVGSAGLAGQLVAITGLGLAVSEDHSAAAADALSAAVESSGPSGVREALERAYDHQVAAMAEIDHLLEQLAEWDNFQSILTLTRDLLNGQKNVWERTRQFAQEH